MQNPESYLSNSAARRPSSRPNRSRRLRNLLVLILVLALAPWLVASGCAPSNSAASDRPAAAAAADEASSVDEASAADEATPVAAFPLRRGRIESVLRYSTNLEAESDVEVYSEASRRVVELLVEEGDAVAAGQVLLRLEDDEQRNSLARIESQLANARREYERQKNLFEQELISEQAFNQATYDLEQLEIAKADVERELGYATVRAPIAGVVTERFVDLGDFVQQNQRLFNIVDFDSIVARIFVPEKELARLHRGQPARVVSPALGDEPRDARVLRIAPTVDSRSGTVKVTLEIPSRRGLVPGMFVEVELIAGVDEQALLVPKRALVYDEDQVFVYRVREAEAEASTAETGAAAGDEKTAAAKARTVVERLLIEPKLEDRFFVQVTDERLAEGDLVVVAGQSGLKPGAAVRLLDLDEALDTFGGDELNGSF